MIQTAKDQIGQTDDREKLLTIKDVDHDKMGPISWGFVFRYISEGKAVQAWLAQYVRIGCVYRKKDNPR